MINEQCPVPRGKGVGGTTLLNGVLYVRGNRADYDYWASIGNPEWSYENILPYFKKAENFHLGNPYYHGKNGPLKVEFHKPNSPQYYAFLEANVEKGRDIVDYNGQVQLGVSPFQMNTINGRRDDNGKAYVAPILNRRNLYVKTNSYVTKILINNATKTAYGVHFMNNGRKYIANANKEVILSAGTISSPALLLLSGIGPADHLRMLNIPVYQDLPVGNNLRDHATFYGLSFVMDYKEPISSIKRLVEDFLNDYGPYTVAANNQGVAFLRTGLSQLPEEVPDIELFLVPSNTTNELTQKYFNFKNETYEELWGNLDTRQLFLINTVLLHPHSTGTVRLQSSDPYEYPLIDFRLLSDPEEHDIATIYEGIKKVLEFTNTEAFRKKNVRFLPPKLSACKDFEFLSKEYWYCSIRQITMHIYHPIGTNKMGPNPNDSVVNSRLQVHGINQLRVADASIFPTTISGHTSAAATMVGEVVSDFIKNTF